MSATERRGQALVTLYRKTGCAILLAGAMLAAVERGAAVSAPLQSDVHALLDVPFMRRAFVVPAGGEAARTRMRSEIDQGRPLIALIEVGLRTYHYVVIVGGTDEQVVLHDPARAPFRVVPWAEFDRAWTAAGRWMMLVLPPSGFRPGLALSAVRLAPEDAYAWQLLATSRYLMGDSMGALDAWNGAGEPRIDTTEIHGAERTRQPVIVRVAGLQPRQVLTREAFGRALRRLRDLPVASTAQMKYEPIDGGLAKLDIFIDERKVAPSGWGAVAGLGGRALLLHEAKVNIAGPLGAGELASASWKWSTGRPRVVLGLALPSPGWLPGVISFQGSWERQSYGTTPSLEGAAVVREERRRVGLRLSDWSTSWLRWQAGAALDHLRAHDSGDLDRNRFEPRDYLGVDGTLDARLAGDRFALTASGGWWASFAGGDRFSAGGVLAAWRSTIDAAVPSWSAVTEIGVASRMAPLALWPGAGTGQGRSGLLRAHPLLKGGVLTGPVFGREVARGSFEYARPVGHARAAILSIAGFVDAAQAWHRLTGLGTSPLFVDAGAGLRVHAGRDSSIRIDIAHGLRGGGTTFSASWGGAWPR